MDRVWAHSGWRGHVRVAPFLAGLALPVDFTSARPRGGCVTRRAGSQVAPAAATRRIAAAST
jgi:hypothetical protein